MLFYVSGLGAVVAVKVGGFLLVVLLHGPFRNVRLWSQVQSGWWSLILFSVSVYPLISGNNLFTNRAAREG